jgi:hypothetical protein
MWSERPGYVVNERVFLWSEPNGLVILAAKIDIGLPYAVSRDARRVPGHDRIWEPARGAKPLLEVLAGLRVDLPGWHIWLSHTSADGRRMVGHATPPGGRTEAVLIELPPPPNDPLPTGFTAADCDAGASGDDQAQDTGPMDEVGTHGPS